MCTKIQTASQHDSKKLLYLAANSGALPICTGKDAHRMDKARQSIFWAHSRYHLCYKELILTKIHHTIMSDNT